MNYVMVQAPEEATPLQRQIDWTYICDGTSAKVGDTVIGDFGYNEDVSMKVVAVGTRRGKLPVRDGQTRYQGPLKTVRLATRMELRLMADAKKRWEAVSRAENRAQAAEEAVIDYRDRNGLGV